MLTSQLLDNINLGHLSEGTSASNLTVFDDKSRISDFANRSLTSGKSAHNLQNLYRLSTQKVEPMEYKKVKIKSNFARGQVILLGSLILSFDKDGICEMEEYKLREFEDIQRSLPGRFTVMQDTSELVAVVDPVSTQDSVETDEVLSYSEVVSDISNMESDSEDVPSDVAVLDDVPPIEEISIVVPKPRKKGK